MPKEYAIWDYTQKVWKHFLDNKDENNVWRGNLTELFANMGASAYRVKILRGLRLMERIDMPQRKGAGAVVKIRFPEVPLSADEFARIKDNVYPSGNQRKQKKLNLLEAQVRDLSTTVAALLGEMEAMKAQIRSIRGRLDSETGRNPTA